MLLNSTGRKAGWFGLSSLKKRGACLGLDLLVSFEIIRVLS